MKVTNEKTEASQAYLTVEMESTEVEEYMQKAYRRIVQKARVPGFRKGKAPRAILERYMGRESLLEDALKELVPQAYEEALKEQKIEAIAKPQLEITQTEPVIFKAVVPLKPTIKLGDYKQVRVEAIPVDEVKDEDVNSVIEQLQHHNATWEPVERPVQFDDLVVIDIVSNVEDKPFINQKAVQYQVLKDFNFPAPGFSDQLLEMKKDEEKEFKLTLPADYSRKELAGKEASFKVKVTELKQEVLPELNDEFAKTIGAELETMDKLKERVKSDLQKRAEEKARLEFQEKVIDAVVKDSQTDFPSILIEVETDRILNQRFERGQQQLDIYLKNVNKTEEQVREEIKPTATTRVTRSLVLGKVAEEEKIEVTPADIDAEVDEMKKSVTENKEAYDRVLGSQEARESIEQTLLTRKTLQKLVDIAKGSAEPAKEPEEKTDKKEESK